MKKHSYTLIALVVIAGPLALSFDQKVNFIQYLLPVLGATGIIGALYIIWDMLVTRAGHWQFNDEFVGTRRLLDLPPGEWLFFLCVPYATLFIFEVVEAYFGMGTLRPELWWTQALAIPPFLALAFLFRRRGYTLLAMSSVALFALVSLILVPGLFASSSFWLFFLFSFLAFSLVNGIYTSLPTIRYNSRAILGIRVGSIPLEDFFYNLAYLGLTLTVYLALKSP